MIIGDIMSGETDTADVFFLIAAIVAVVAGVARLARRVEWQQYGAAMTSIAVAAIAVGLLAL